MPKLYSLTGAPNGQPVLCLGDRPLATLGYTPLYEASDSLDTPEQLQTFAENLVRELNWSQTHMTVENLRGGAVAFSIALCCIVTGTIGFIVGSIL